MSDLNSIALNEALKQIEVLTHKVQELEISINELRVKLEDISSSASK